MFICQIQAFNLLLAHWSRLQSQWQSWFCSADARARCEAFRCSWLWLLPVAFLPPWSGSHGSSKASCFMMSTHRPRLWVMSLVTFPGDMERACRHTAARVDMRRWDSPVGPVTLWSFGKLNDLNVLMFRLARSKKIKKKHIETRCIVMLRQWQLRAFPSAFLFGLWLHFQGFSPRFNWHLKIVRASVRAQNQSQSQIGIYLVFPTLVGGRLIFYHAKSLNQLVWVKLIGLSPKSTPLTAIATTSITSNRLSANTHVPEAGEGQHLP